MRRPGSLLLIYACAACMTASPTSTPAGPRCPVRLDAARFTALRSAISDSALVPQLNRALADSALFASLSDRLRRSNAREMEFGDQPLLTSPEATRVLESLQDELRRLDSCAGI